MVGVGEIEHTEMGLLAITANKGSHASVVRDNGDQGALGQGRMLFELSGVPVADAKRAFQLGASKLPIPTRFVLRRGQ